MCSVRQNTMQNTRIFGGIGNSFWNFARSSLDDSTYKYMAKYEPGFGEGAGELSNTNQLDPPFKRLERL